MGDSVDPVITTGSDIFENRNRARKSIPLRAIAIGRTSGRYTLRIAESDADIERIQKLRFAIFNVELGCGYESSFRTGLDTDPFDLFARHLIVETKQGEIIGTYRLQTGTEALANLGFFCGGEFDLAPFSGIEPQTLELGRACVRADHRNATVIGLLWGGILNLSASLGLRFLLGSCSLFSTMPAEAAAVYHRLKRRYLAGISFRAFPHPECAIPLGLFDAIPPRIPKLFSAYLSFGAKVCGPPALDRDFRTSDFLCLIDLDSAPAYKEFRRFCNNHPTE